MFEREDKLIKKSWKKWKSLELLQKSLEVKQHQQDPLQLEPTLLKCVAKNSRSQRLLPSLKKELRRNSKKSRKQKVEVGQREMKTK